MLPSQSAKGVCAVLLFSCLSCSSVGNELAASSEFGLVPEDDTAVAGVEEILPSQDPTARAALAPTKIESAIEEPKAPKKKR
jgi:hypothetical protein